MCIIAIKPKDKRMFGDEILETMFSNNPDGCGYMYVHKGKVVVRKGFMTVEDLKDNLSKNRHLEDSKDINIVFHFRIGTSGYYDELNCHPFPIYQKNATVCRTDIAIAHNGILHDYEPSRNSSINDTQVFIQTVLRRLKKGFQYDKDILMLIEELIGTNKFALLDDKDHLTLIGDFIDDNGYYFSNTSYKPRRVSVHKVSNKGIMWHDINSIWDDSDETGFWKDFDSRHTS